MDPATEIILETSDIKEDERTTLTTIATKAESFALRIIITMKDKLDSKPKDDLDDKNALVIEVAEEDDFTLVIEGTKGNESTQMRKKGPIQILRRKPLRVV